MEKKKITLVTHDGLCHSDDALCYIVLKDYYEKLNYEVELVRTRKEEEIPAGEVIVFDVFGGELDHHKTDEVERGRTLSSIGKTWGKYKEEFKSSYQLDEESWNNIDREFISPVDVTDNTGIMNPLNYSVNAIRSTEEDLELAFCKVCQFLQQVWDSVIVAEQKQTKMRESFKALPTEEIDSLKMKVNESTNFIQAGTFTGEDGYMWKTPRGTYMVKMAKESAYELIKGLEKGNGVIFTHKNGFVGEIETKDDLKKVVTRKERA